jgi:hypothetical protein
MPSSHAGKVVRLSKKRIVNLLASARDIGGLCHERQNIPKWLSGMD